MKPMPNLAALVEKAKAKRIFGTKMRSFIRQANGFGIKDIVNQQFETARQIIDAGLVPIIEPEVDIHCPLKQEAEELLKAEIIEKFHELPAGAWIMLKITLPDRDGFYADLIEHPNVLRVVALSGGYTREQANERLRRNHGVVASFSRARSSKACRPSNPMPSSMLSWIPRFKVFSTPRMREGAPGGTIVQIGIFSLGRMGGNIVRRLP